MKVQFVGLQIRPGCLPEVSFQYGLESNKAPI